MTNKSQFNKSWLQWLTNQYKLVTMTNNSIQVGYNDQQFNKIGYNDQQINKSWLQIINKSQKVGYNDQQFN